MRFRIGMLVIISILGMVSGVFAQAIPEADIRAAIDRGAEFLKRSYTNGGGGGQGHPSGERSLAGIAMLEATVPPSDPVIQTIAKFVRDDAVSQSKTYEVALAIMFLDRLGEPQDKLLIQMLALRLMVGQTGNGGWSYSTINGLPGDEVQRIQAGLADPKQAELNTPANKPTDAPKPKDPKAVIESPILGKVHPLVARHIEVLRQLRATGGVGGGYEGMSDDNSNTQFATLALWIARRHNVATDKALQNVARRFRISQLRPSGGWDYMLTAVPGMAGKPSMTCAGLLGLLMSYGLAGESPTGKAAPDFKKDPAITAGFNYLGAALRRAAGPQGAPGAPGNPMLDITGGGVTTSDYYFLWSLERVSAIASADKITGLDWFHWGAFHILRQQKPDGSWAGSYGAQVDTCFAVLFLCKANLARDLTQTLTGRSGAALGMGGRPKSGEPGDPAAMAQAKPELPSPLNVPKSTIRPPETPAIGTVTELTDKLVAATPGPFERILQEYHDGKGPAYTEALAKAAGQLEGDRQAQTREKLAYRLARFGPDTLRGNLKSKDIELRRASALAAAIRAETALVPDLIAMLDDDVMTVARSAYAALKSITGEDFGPKSTAEASERARSSAAWRRWWSQQKK